MVNIPVFCLGFNHPFGGARLLPSTVVLAPPDLCHCFEISQHFLSVTSHCLLYPAVFGPMRGQTFRGLAVTNGWILDHLEVSYGTQILQGVYWDPWLGITFQKSPTWRKHVTPCEPWCWNMHTYIYPRTWHSFVGVHIPAAWWANLGLVWCSLQESDCRKCDEMSRSIPATVAEIFDDHTLWLCQNSYWKWP